jgi:hypothetical protein
MNVFKLQIWLRCELVSKLTQLLWWRQAQCCLVVSPLSKNKWVGASTRPEERVASLGFRRWVIQRWRTSTRNKRSAGESVELAEQCSTYVPIVCTNIPLLLPPLLLSKCLWNFSTWRHAKYSSHQMMNLVCVSIGSAHNYFSHFFTLFMCAIFCIILYNS